MEEFNGVIGIVFKRGNPNKFALISNNESGNVTFPAGGREEWENTSIETLKREVEEETGLLENEYEIINTHYVHEFIYSSKKAERAGKKAIQPVYFIETEKEDLKSKDSEVSFKGWCTKEEVLELLTFSDSKDVFRMVLPLIEG